MRQGPRFKAGPLLIDLQASQITKYGSVTSLTPTERDVLNQLLEDYVDNRPGVVRREDFRPWRGETRAAHQRHPVDEVVARLNTKLQGDVKIKGVRKTGYRIMPNVSVTRVSIADEDLLRAGAVRQLNVHTGRAISAASAKYRQLVKDSADPESFFNLALSHVNKGTTGFCVERPQVSIAKAREVIAQALSLHPHSSFLYALRGLTFLIYDYDWKLAASDLAVAISLNEDDPYAHQYLAHLHVSKGNFETGVNHARVAAALQPNKGIAVFTYPWMLVLARRSAEAIPLAESALEEFSPFATGHIFYGHALLASGEINNAVEEYKRSLEIEPSPDAVASLGHAYGRDGKRKAALACLDQLRMMKSAHKIPYVPAYFEALIHAGVGETAKSVAALEKALIQKCDWLVQLGVDPRWDGLKGERRFQGLLRELGLVHLIEREKTSKSKHRK